MEVVEQDEYEDGQIMSADIFASDLPPVPEVRIVEEKVVEVEPTMAMDGEELDSAEQRHESSTVRVRSHSPPPPSQAKVEEREKANAEDEAIESVFTPVLSGDAVIDLLAGNMGAGEEEIPEIATEATKIRCGVQCIFPSVDVSSSAGGLTDAELVRVTRSAGVHLATGDSDAESVRDYDAGPGKQRFHRREAY